jgi:hypothetical protein
MPGGLRLGLIGISLKLAQLWNLLSPSKEPPLVIVRARLEKTAKDSQQLLFRPETAVRGAGKLRASRSDSPMFGRDWWELGGTPAASAD